MKAWLQAYYGEIPGESGQGLVKYSMLDYHGGEIQEAVNLEFGGLTDYSHVGIFVGNCFYLLVFFIYVCLNSSALTTK